MIRSIIAGLAFGAWLATPAAAITVGPSSTVVADYNIEQADFQPGNLPIVSLDGPFQLVQFAYTFGFGDLLNVGESFLVAVTEAGAPSPIVQGVVENSSAFDWSSVGAGPGNYETVTSGFVTFTSLGGASFDLDEASMLISVLATVDATSVGLGPAYQTTLGAYVSLTNFRPLEVPDPTTVPLPATGLMLVGALLACGGARLRTKTGRGREA